MLKKAPPLHQDISFTTQYQGSADINEEPALRKSTSLDLAPSGLIASKTTVDALEELREYREMKESLLKQGKTP